MQDKGESSVAFPVTNGVKQRSALVPTLFSIMFSEMKIDGSDIGIDLQYRTDGFVFDLRRLQAKTKVKTHIVYEFLFAADCALNATTKINMQNSDNFGQTINIKKTEVMHQPAPGKPYVEPNITIKRQRLKVVEKFTNIDSTLSEPILMDDEVNTRLTKASAVFGRLNRNV